jgi:hypothetical protein
MAPSDVDDLRRESVLWIALAFIVLGGGFLWIA